LKNIELTSARIVKDSMKNKIAGIDNSFSMGARPSFKYK
jgi:hypothetical protein